MPIGVVFDTNIHFSSVGWRGAPYRCLELCRQGSVQSITCAEILAELEDKLISKIGMSRDDAAEVVNEIKSFSRIVEIEGSVKAVVADPDDDAVIECAIIAD